MSSSFSDEKMKGPTVSLQTQQCSDNFSPIGIHIFIILMLKNVFDLLQLTAFSVQAHIHNKQISPWSLSTIYSIWVVDLHPLYTKIAQAESKTIKYIIKVRSRMMIIVVAIMAVARIDLYSHQLLVFYDNTTTWDADIRMYTSSNPLESWWSYIL